jgi:phosphatidylglycerophosphatase A
MKYRLSLTLASGFYIGFIPGAPGTYASIATTILYYLAYHHFRWIPPHLHMSVLCLISMAGVLTSALVSKHTGTKDPSYVVIDEVAGQLLTFLWVPFGALNLILGTIAFRIFDIWKPYPIRKLESFENGVGVMADDLLAGIYANLALQIINLFL